MAKPDDWLKATQKQRQDLYKTVDRLEKLRELRWSDFVQKALGRVVGDSFRENFRKGLISRADASLAYRYLQAHHPHAAAALDIDAFTNKIFGEFILHYRRLGLISVLPETGGPPFLSHRRGPEWTEYPFEISDPICFNVRLPFEYNALVVLHGSHQGWFPLRIAQPTPDEDLSSTRLVQQARFGAQTICTPPPTEKETERRRGSNCFLFLAGDFDLIGELAKDWNSEVKITDAELTRLADRLSRSISQVWVLSQINATGIGPY